MIVRHVDARWLHCPIPPERQHVSDFGRIAGFDMALVRVETDDGLVGWGEAKAAVGSAGVCARWCACIDAGARPAADRPGCAPDRAAVGGDVQRHRAHYALARGRAFPVLGRRGLHDRRR